ncbi:LOW QUALITY PROTEIN: sugar transporter SWEET1 [Nylanderia fulva]|uniref:LOW QUALITY PROTEIN: sugar transporter SWEET1 n=1 Tax=Nylanderia fulva TaxID=613905 RepID=UPI0010FB4535|nr:LOW QUALITY PROTEIN: sugar transporter SWEET1 [Nylanderia fulva]
MTLAEIKDILAFCASICTVLQFLAGVLVCKKYIRNGTTGDSSSLAFMTCFMSCSLWLRYGVLIGDWFIVCVNIFGTVLQICYMLIYISYSVKGSTTVKQFIVAICFVLSIYFYSIYQEDKVLAAKYVGFLSCSLTVLFFASPLISLVHVIKVKSTDSLPFPVIVSSMIVSCQWFTYGCLLGDQFIQIPNFMGCVLSAFQLSLFLIYPSKRTDQAYFI